MRDDITKLCADSLRIYLNDKHGIKLRSGHAHEIVAAFFGYNSAIALRQDNQYSIDNLELAEFIVLTSPRPLVDQRLKNLQGLPYGLPSGDTLAKEIYSILVSEKSVQKKVHSNFHDLAIFLAKERLDQHTKHLGINPAPQWIIEVGMETKEEGVVMTVTFSYSTDAGNHRTYSKIEVKLRSISGRIGYGAPEIMPTFYTGQMSDPAFRLEHGIT